jgi:nitroreductase
MEKTLSQIIRDRRATPSFDGSPIAETDLEKILFAGTQSPSSYNLQPWRFFVVRTEEGKRRLRAACYNQGKVEEASAVIVACGDADGWRNGDLEEMLKLGRENGMSESYAEQAKVNIPNYLGNHPNMPMWLNRQVMLAFTHMMLMAESLGFDTAPMEGFEEQKIKEVLKLPLSYTVVAVLAIGRLKGTDKFKSGRFGMARTVFDEEYPRPIRFKG